MDHLRDFARWLVFLSLLTAVSQAKDPLYDNGRIPVPGVIEAENFVSVSGSVPTRETPRGEVGRGESLFAPSPGSRANYSVNVAEPGDYEVTLRYSRTGPGVAPFTLRAQNGGATARFDLARTFDADNFQTLKGTINLRAGNQTLFGEFGGSGSAWSGTYLNWIGFRKLRATGNPAFVVEVSPSAGNDASSGGAGSPVSSLPRALTLVRNRLASSATGPIEVRLLPGYHELTNTLRLDRNYSADWRSPVTVRGITGQEPVVIGGGRRINPRDLRVVTDTASLDRLKPAARGKVFRVRLDDADWQRRFTRRIRDSHYEASVSWNGRYLMLARFPNKGLTVVEKINGSPGRMRVRGINGAAWAREFDQTGDVFVSGHMVADEFEESDFVSDINNQGVVFFEDFRRFTKDKRTVRVLNMLYELDSPGEWYYDAASKDFYIWPVENPNLNPEIRVGGRFTILQASEVNFWKWQNLVFSDNGGTFNFDGPSTLMSFSRCHDTIFGGCTIRNSNARNAARWDNCDRSLITGNDFYDTFTPFNVSGGDKYPVRQAQTEFSNNYATRIRARAYGGGGIQGAGVVFKNNYFHDIQAGQSYSSASDMLSELNEWHSSGYELGDWNVMYHGPGWEGLGNTFRHNFAHHLMKAPLRKGIGAFRYDDGGTGGAWIGNLFYRVGEYAINVAYHGNTIRNNIAVDGNSFFKTVDPDGPLLGRKVLNAADVAAEIRLQRNPPAANPKARKILPAEAKFGFEYWKTPYFGYKYPEMERPWRTNPFFRSDFFYDTNYTSEIRFPSWARGDAATTEARALERLSDFTKPILIGKNQFVNLPKLDLRLKSGFSRQSGWYDLPFFQIGLFKDQYRRNIPHKNSYRAQARLKWSNDAGRNRNNESTWNNPFLDRAFDQKVTYDVGTFTSPLWPNATLVTNETQGSYGWRSTSGLTARDLGVNNALNRDSVISSGDVYFEQDVENGPWYALVTFFDTTARTGINFSAESDPAASGNGNFSVAAGTPVNKTLSTMVRDGRLSLKFSGGRRSISRIIIQRAPFGNNGAFPNPRLGTFANSDDISSPGRAGLTSAFDNGEVQLFGSGADIWGTRDEFHFAHRAVRSADATLITRVSAFDNTNVWAKAGLHFRDSTDGRSKNVGIYVRPDGRVSMQTRPEFGGASRSVGGLTGPTGLAKWLRLVKSGGTYIGSWSTNGTDWTEAGRLNVSLRGSSLLGGLAVSSHDRTKLARARFTNYSQTATAVGVGTPPPPPPPTDTFAATFAAPSPANNATLASGASVRFKVETNAATANVRLFRGSQLVRQENGAPYEWGLDNQTADFALLRNLAVGNYTFRAVATAQDGSTSEISRTVRVQDPSTGGGGGTPTGPTTTGTFQQANRYFWDFTDNTLPLQGGARKFTPEMTDGFFRWINPTRLGVAQHTGGQLTDNFRQSILFGRSVGRLRHQVQNGIWSVQFELADGFVQNNMIIRAEGVTRASNIDVPARTLRRVRFDVEVRDGFLDLELDDSDTNKVWTVAGLILNRVGDLPAPDPTPPAQTVWRFDFGTESSPLQPGWTRITANTRSGTARWLEGGLSERDRGRNPAEDAVRQDLIFGSENTRFRVDTGNGRFRVRIMFGDYRFRHDQFTAIAEGAQFPTVTTEPGTNPRVEIDRETTVEDGNLTIEFRDLGGTDVNWSAMGVIINRLP